MHPLSIALRTFLLLLALCPLTASATLVTMTFDRGAEDTTIVDPTGNYHGPYAWVEEGVRADGFWAEDVGTAAGAHALGHYHRARNVYQDVARAPFGFSGEFTHAFTNDLQGLVITLENGGTFDLVSIDYDVWFTELPEDDALQRLPWSFAADAPKILVSRSFDPSLPDFESQWTAFDAISDLYGAGGSEDDWHTLDLTGSGFTGLTSIMISQSAAQTWLDNIVIDVYGITPVPEPGTALLMGLGLAMLSRRARLR